MKNGWNEWSKHVLKELERLNENSESLTRRIEDLRSDIVALKVKAGMWGLFGGLAPVLVAVLVYLTKELLERH